ncbi:MAG: hypothetical protein M5R36_12000 [Deltaproteobacteria bacterium]|nr:hypothetical protein [Deltaproteobacteria bacterium]
MRRGFRRIALYLAVALCVFALWAPIGCSCGNDDDSGNSDEISGDPFPIDDDDTQADDDLDDDVTDDDDELDDDLLDDDTEEGYLGLPGICVEEWDDVSECPRGFLTPEGACVERVAGGAPGREGLSIAVGPDNLTYVAAVKGRDLRIYKIDGTGSELSCTVRTVDFLAAGPAMVMDADGHFHLAYTNLRNDMLRYATDATGTWVFEDVAVVGPERWFADDIFVPRPSLDRAGPGRKSSYCLRQPERCRPALRA